MLTSFQAVMTVLLKFITQVKKKILNYLKNRFNRNFHNFQDSSKCSDEKQAIEKEMDTLKKFCPVLNAFLNGNNDLQLIAIYAMQVHWYSIDYPKGESELKS